MPKIKCVWNKKVLFFYCLQYGFYEKKNFYKQKNRVIMKKPTFSAKVDYSGRLWAAVPAKPNLVQKIRKALKCDDSLDLEKVTSAPYLFLAIFPPKKSKNVKFYASRNFQTRITLKIFDGKKNFIKEKRCIFLLSKMRGK